MEALVHRMVIGDNPDGALPTTILRNEMFDVRSKLSFYGILSELIRSKHHNFIQKEDFVSAKTKIDRSVQEEMRRR